MKTNVTYIISNINKALAFEWIADYLDKEKFELSFILLNPGSSELEDYLKQQKINVTTIPYNGKKDIPKAVLKTYTLLKRYKTQVVHTHLFDANLVGLTAARLAGIKKRIYTRHHSSYHHDYFPGAVKYDRYCNRLATSIVAISENVSRILHEKENVPLSKIKLIHHGFELDSFINVPEENVEKLRTKYNIAAAQRPVIGVISRYTEWKGVQFIIPAFKQLLEKYPDALLLLANADGNYKAEIKNVLQTLPAKNYCEIIFEPELFALYQLFDVFVHVPINAHAEAFGQIYVEALAAGIPAVFTLSGIAGEFITDKKNALVVAYENTAAIYNAVSLVLEDKALAEKISAQGQKDAFELFALKKMITKTEQLY